MKVLDESVTNINAKLKKKKMRSKRHDLKKTTEKLEWQFRT
jgi:hypothetical protein